MSDKLYQLYINHIYQLYINYVYIYIYKLDQLSRLYQLSHLPWICSAHRASQGRPGSTGYHRLRRFLRLQGRAGRRDARRGRHGGGLQRRGEGVAHQGARRRRVRRGRRSGETMETKGGNHGFIIFLYLFFGNYRDG